MQQRLVAALAIVVALIVAADVVLLATGTVTPAGRIGDDSFVPASTSITETTSTTTSTTTAAPPTTPTTASPAEQAVRDEVAALQPVVTGLRGLEFRKPVAVVFEPDDARFRERALALIRPDAGRVAADNIWLRAAGITDGADVAGPAYAALVGGDLPIASYDPSTDELVARAVPVTPFGRAELVHELVVALQDQHTELHRPELRLRGDDAHEAFQALVLGMSSSMLVIYVSRLPAPERNAVAREAQRQEEAQALRLKDQTWAGIHLWPYLFEDSLVRGLLEPPAHPHLNRAFDAPPTSAEEVLVVGRYGNGDRPVVMTAPRADGQPLGEGTAGLQRLGPMFERHIDPTKEGTGNYDVNGLAGWDNDRYVVWKDGRGRSCMRMRIAVERGNFAPDEERTRMLATLRRWAEHHGGARIEQETSPIVVSACR